ncbi:hypothetical protein [Frankia sp. AiPa1]|uniref:hypothetical protein n=1 Tax=Frankia sp. AiPa1 TaxID=573492 RepID=UPI00202AE4CF|nr:hypothetical protein [Frankia sp. AiPa1]MCL9759681.1 hypothetical protein [Frankia sp. AiPa1]
MTDDDTADLGASDDGTAGGDIGGGAVVGEVAEAGEVKRNMRLIVLASRYQ